MTLAAANRDDRLQPLLRNQRPHERFLILGMFTLLEHFGLLDQVMDGYTERDVNWQRMAAGKPMLHWNGKTRAQIVREVGEAGADEVHRIKVEMGLELPDRPKPKMPSRPPAEPPAEKKDEPSKDDEGNETSKDATPAEPMFAGRALSSLEGLSDAELLKIEGFSRATVKAVRQAQSTRGAASAQ